MPRCILPYGLDEPEHALLQQILTVAACQEVWTGAGAHQSMVAPHQDLLGVAVSLLHQSAQRLIAEGLHPVIFSPYIIHHISLYLFTKEFVKSIEKFCQK